MREEYYCREICKYKWVLHKKQVKARGVKKRDKLIYVTVRGGQT